MKNINIEYTAAWKFIPSNMFSAFIKSKTHKIVKKFDIFLSSIGLSRKEKDNDLITRLSSIKIIVSMIKKFKNNFFIGDKLNLSSYKPTKKHINKPPKKETYSLVFKKWLLRFRLKK